MVSLHLIYKILLQYNLPKFVFIETPIYIQIWDLITLIVYYYGNVFSINV